MTLSERLNELLNEKYMSAAKLAAAIGLSGVAVRNWRRTNASVKLEHLLRVAEYFECSLDYLCGRTEDEGIFRKDTPPCFPERLKALIGDSKTPIDRIAKDMQLDRHNFYDWFNGMPPLSSSLIILANYFGCSIDYLVGLES